MEETHDANGCVKTALDNHIIVKNILNCLDWKTLCVCRQVSKLWYEYSLDLWRELASPVTLNPEFDIGKFQVLNKLPLSLVGHEDEYRWGGINKCNNITIYCTRLEGNFIDYFSFLRIKGDHIRKFHFDFCQFLNVRQIKDIVFCIYTPNLSSLALKNVGFCFWEGSHGKGDLEKKHNAVVYREVKSLTSFDIEYHSPGYKPWPFSWVELLCKYPNLKRLRVAEYAAAELELIFTAVREVHKANQGFLLTAIDVGDRGYGKKLGFPFPLYESIRDSGHGSLCNLTSISIAVSPTDRPEHLEDLFEYVAGKLMHLTIIGSFSGKNQSLNFSVAMTKLLSIKLEFFHLKNLNFLSKAPTLQKLYIYERKGSQDSYNVIANTTLVTGFECTLLSTFACNQVVRYEHEDISCLQRWMPNLRSLKLHLNNFTFFAVCEMFPKLRLLHICHSQVTDYGYTGDQLYATYKDPDDDDDNIRTKYWEVGFAQSDSDEISVGDELNYSDIDFSEEENTPSPNNDNNKEMENSSSSESSDSICKETDNVADVNVKELDELEQTTHDDNAQTKQDSFSNKNNTTNEQHSTNDENVTYLESNNGGTSSQDGTSNGDIISVECNRECTVSEEIYGMTYKAYGTQCPYNATCLQDLEVLVVERCEEEYGESGLISSVPFRRSFLYLPRLREVWAESGVTTISGQRYATFRGLYQHYEERNDSRPGFMD